MTRSTSIHDHCFGLDRPQPGESRVRLVIVITAITMVVEIATGLLFGSMALLADGLHMGSHAAALFVSALAYAFARRRARDASFSFGTGKFNALGGFAGAILLAGFALLMAWESVERLVEPVAIAFDQAIVVAVVGLIVNLLSAWLLRDHDHHHHHHDEESEHARPHGGRAHEHDHNLRSAYLHVLADALTSLLAIVALLSGKYFGWSFLDPVMGIVGAVVILVWSRGLLRDASRVLLDRQAPPELLERTRAYFEDEDTRVLDLHLWSIGPGMRAAALVVECSKPLDADTLRRRLPAEAHIVHSTIEIHGPRLDATR